MDVLDYTKEQLIEMSDEQLEVLLKEAEDKESYWNTDQLARKIQMNSLYGAIGNAHFSLFNEKLACAITGNGRYFIRKASNYAEAALQKLHKSEKPYILYNDTDSFYYHIEPFMNMYQEKNPDESIDSYVTWADSFEKKVIQPSIQRTIDDFSAELNAYNKSVIGCEREVISDSGVFTAKKKYFLRVRDNEGTRYAENDPKIKIMGLSVIQSSTPTWSKKYLKDSIPHILDKDESELRDWVKKIKSKYIAADLNEIASSGSVSNLNYELGVDKGIPIGSRAALAHNKYVTDNNLEDRFLLIQPGDKCKRLFLTMPNPFDSNICAFTNDEFVEELRPYVDYDMNFEKGFLSPLKLMVDALNYNLEKQTESLDDW